MLSKKRNDMKDEILQIAYNLEKGMIDEGTAKQELCILLGVSSCFPIDAHSFEVFAIKDSEDSITGKQAFIGYKLNNGNFHFVDVPFTEPK